MSSCEWPLVKQAIWARATLPTATHMAKSLRTELFFNSRQQLSPWMWRQAPSRRTFSDRRVSAWLNSSHERLELLLTKWGLNPSNARCPCTNRVVDVSRGLLKALNSLLFMIWLLGQECLAASMLSKMQQIVEGEAACASRRLEALIIQ